MGFVRGVVERELLRVLEKIRSFLNRRRKFIWRLEDRSDSVEHMAYPGGNRSEDYRYFVTLGVST